MFYLDWINSIYIPQTVFDENSPLYLTFQTINVHGLGVVVSRNEAVLLPREQELTSEMF
jgi:hypothetical protein